MSNSAFLTSENIFTAFSSTSFDEAFSELINELPSKDENEKSDITLSSLDELTKNIEATTSKKNESIDLDKIESLHKTFVREEINTIPTDFSEFPGNSCAFDYFCKKQPEAVIQALFPNKSYKQLYYMFINYDRDHICKFEMPLTLKVCEKLIFYKAMKSSDSTLPKEFKKHFNERKYRILGDDVFAMLVAKLNIFTCEEISKYANYKTEALDSVEYELSKRTLYKSSNKSLPETTKAMMGKYKLQQLYFNSSFEKVAELLRISIETLEKIFQHIELLAKQLNILLQGDRKIELSKKKQDGENAKNIFIYNNQLSSFVEEQKGKYQTFEKKPLLVQARLISVLRYTLYQTFGWNAWVCWFLIRKKCYDLAQNYGRIRDNMIKKGRLEALGVSKRLYQKRLYSKIIRLSEECKAAYDLDPYQITLFNESSFRNDVDSVNNEDCENIEQFKKIYFNGETEFRELKNQDDKYMIPKFKMIGTPSENKKVCFGNQFQFLKHHDKVQKQLIMSLYLLEDESKNTKNDSVYNLTLDLKKTKTQNQPIKLIFENTNQAEKEKVVNCSGDTKNLRDLEFKMLDSGFLEKLGVLELEGMNKAAGDRKRGIEKVQRDFNGSENFGQKRMCHQSSSIDTFNETLLSKICRDNLVADQYEDNYVAEFEMDSSFTGLYDASSDIKLYNDNTGTHVFNDEPVVAAYAQNSQEEQAKYYDIPDLKKVTDRDGCFSVDSTPTVFPEESIGRLFGEFFNLKGLATNQDNSEQPKQYTETELNLDLDLTAEISFDYPAEFQIF